MSPSSRLVLSAKSTSLLSRLSFANLPPLAKVTLRSGTYNVYRYTATGFKPLDNVISYFKLFPLQTKKAISFEKWLTVHNKVSDKLHLTEEGLAKVRILQKQINLNNSITNKTGAA